MDSLFLRLAIVIIPAIGCLLFTGMWTFFDMKARDEKQDDIALWTFISLVSWPFGFIIYLQLGRKKAEVNSKDNKKYLVGLITCSALLVLAIMMRIIFIIRG